MYVTPRCHEKQTTTDWSSLKIEALLFSSVTGRSLISGEIVLCQSSWEGVKCEVSYIYIYRRSDDDNDNSSDDQMSNIRTHIACKIVDYTIHRQEFVSIDILRSKLRLGCHPKIIELILENSLKALSFRYNTTCIIVLARERTRATEIPRWHRQNSTNIRRTSKKYWLIS